MKESQKTVNPKDNVENLFHAAVAGDEHLEVMDIDGCLAYYDGCNNYTRVYYYDDTAETVTKRIIMDEQVSQFLDRESLATFLVEKADHNAIMVMEKLAFIWMRTKTQVRQEKRWKMNMATNMHCSLRKTVCWGSCGSTGRYRSSMYQP